VSRRQIRQMRLSIRLADQPRLVVSQISDVGAVQVLTSASHRPVSEIFTPYVAGADTNLSLRSGIADES